MRSRITLLLTCCLAVSALAQNTRVKAPQLLPWSQQLAVREQWLAKRHEMILPMMRAHQIDMWIVVNEEFHDDPLTQYIAPPRPYAGRPRLLCLHRHGRKGSSQDCHHRFCRGESQALLRIARRAPPRRQSLARTLRAVQAEEDCAQLRGPARCAAQHHLRHLQPDRRENGRGCGPAFCSRSRPDRRLSRTRASPRNSPPTRRWSSSQTR